MQISQKKRDKIAEQILSLLYHSFPRQLFTSGVSDEIARDEEFTLKLLKELEKKNLVASVKKNPQGKIYSKRTKWRLSNQAHEIYRQHQ
ncbi:hypothetical protein HYT92_00540 [Candidatus Pacearchaeota archaeon]|nr:hypothetical protein [Candidatus Pacearchaeota archaeon]